MTQLRHHGGGRRRWPLVVSLAVHVLLAGAWLHSASRKRAVDEPQRAFTVLLLQKPRPVPPPVPLPSPEHPGARSQASAPAPVAPRAPAEPEPITALPAPVAAPAAPSTTDILAAARRDAGKVDRELRGKTGVIKMEGSSRFERAIAEAHIDSSHTASLEQYTAPDGEVLYRKRVGDRVSCRQSGSAGAPAPWRSESDIRAGAGSAKTLDMTGEAGETLCPDSGPDWKRK